ncbi:MAG: phosphotransferase, partial [Planctomycetaceae bacterium]|nr:phosphotransferase [Planctomycetaceae bacterium]
VPTVRAVALGESRRSTWVREQYFLTEALPGAEPLGCLLDEWSVGRSRRSPTWRRRLLREFAELVAAAHRSGVLHNDLHTRNILVSEDTQGVPRLYLIDVPKVRFGRALDWAASRNNLAMIYSGNLWQFTRTELARLWSIYRANRPELSLPDPRAAAREVLERGWDHARFTARGRDRRALRINREFYHQRNSRGTGYAVTEVAPATLRAAIADGAALLHQGLDQPHKLTHGSVVVQTRLPLAAGEIEIAYKRYRPRNLRKFLQALWRPSRARESFVRGHALLARGIPTPRPLLAIAPNGRRNIGVSYLATTWIQGALNLHLYAWRLSAASAAERGDRCRRAARSLGKMTGRLHAWRISHHDLKGCNVLLADRDDEVQAYLIDLDGIRWHRRLPERKVVENLARLAVSAQVHTWIGRGNYLRFLRAYLSYAHRSRADWKPLWRAAARRSAEITARLKREEGPLA